VREDRGLGASIATVGDDMIVGPSAGVAECIIAPWQKSRLHVQKYICTHTVNVGLPGVKDRSENTLTSMAFTT
jgi:hypothetical protein